MAETKSTLYENLNPKQVKCINMMLNPDFKMSIGELCKEIKIHPATYSEWRKNPDFKKALSDGLSELALHDLPEVWRALINDCKDSKAYGHTAAIKIYFEMLGLYSQNINISGTEKVIIEGADKLEN